LTTRTFDQLGLSPRTLHALARAGFEHPTPIQAQAIPPALAGRDVIGTAATGTGKTAAFLLPIIERLASGRDEAAGERGERPSAVHAGGHATGPRALVLAPTRELALQIAEQLERFGKPWHVRGIVVIGGVGMGPQATGLRDHEVIVATPGRLVDHLQQGTARLDGIEVLVLDEADRMLDMGFEPQLRRILARLPRKRQSLLFSATMAGEVATFARAHLADPVKVEVARSGTTAERAVQQVFLADAREKLPLLLALLEQDDLSTLVFTRTKRRADRLWKAIGRVGHKVARLHADRSQAQRRMALEGFRDGQYRVLVATDIAARGIDVAEIGHVVNFDLPHVPEDYVHRVGRTARMAASGRASSFAAPEELEQLRGIERLTRAPIPRAEVPRASAVFQAELERAAAAQADPGPRAAPRGPNRNQRRAAVHRAARTGAAAGQATPAPRAPGPHGAPRKPRSLGTWGSKRRR
jgi:ATP-dependent RNA helicase RhlE